MKISSWILLNPSGSKDLGALAPESLALEVSKAIRQTPSDLSIVGHLLWRALRRKVVGIKQGRPLIPVGSKRIEAVVQDDFAQQVSGAKLRNP